MNLSPTICNICHGKVIFTSNSLIYGSEYGSGKMYYCAEGGSYVGTHIPRLMEAPIDNKKIWGVNCVL